MNYYEIALKGECTIDLTVVYDLLADELGEIGFESFTQTDEGMTAFIQASLYDRAKMEARLADFPLPDVSFSFTEQLVEGRDWNEEWEKNYFQPIRIGKECVIRASFHEAEEGFKHTILIDPKMAFGTGNHETTRLMLERILTLEPEGKELLDMGCGTAVLAILAKMKGASRVVAIDIDEWAYQNALENIALNRTESIEVLLGGAEQLQGMAPFDIIFANINRNILVRDMGEYAKVLKVGGVLFLSGFYEEDIPVIAAACRENGLTADSHTQENRWVSVMATK